MEQIGSEYNFNTGGSIKALDDLIIRVGKLDKEVQQLAKTSKGAGDSVDGTGKKAKKTKTEFDALGNSINQVTREFPAFAFSAQTGFLAVSNNIPILLDSINQLKEANKALAAEGKATIPVFKQVIASLFSWQTALSLLISFTVLYGKEIGNFIMNTFKASGSIDILKERVSALNEAYKSKQLSSNIEDLVTLKNNLELAKNGYLNKLDVLKIYNEEFGRVLGTTNDVKIAEQNLIDATPNLIRAYIARAASAKLVADSAQTIIDIEKEKAKVTEQSIKTTNFQLGQLSDQYNKRQIKTQEEFLKKKDEILKRNSVENSIKERINGAGRLADLMKQLDSEIKLSQDFSKKSEEILKGMGLIDDGSKQREAERLKKIKEANEKAKELLQKRVQNELNIAQEAYIKEISLKDATNKTKEEAEIRLLKAQIAIFEKYKKYDEQYAQDSLDTREKLAEKKIAISDEEKAEKIKRLQEEYKNDDAFMKKTIDNELDAINEKYVKMKEGKVLSSQEQMELELMQTQETIAYLEQVKEAGEKYSDDYVKLKDKESKLLTNLGRNQAKERIKIEREVQDALIQLGQGSINALLDYRTSTNRYEAEQEIKNAEDLFNKKQITEDEFNRRKKEALNEQARTQRQIDLAQIQINTAISIAKTFAQFGFPAGIPLAVLAAAEGAVQYAFASAQPLPQFAKGTDRVMGGRKGVDSVHALLMPDEAVIPAKANLERPQLAKAWIDGNLDKHLMMNYIKPAIEENNRRWEATLKVNQSSTFIRNDNFSDKRIVDSLGKINRKLSTKEQPIIITRNKGRIWN